MPTPRSRRTASRLALSIAAAATAATSLAPHRALATDRNWIGSDNGTWTASSNWSPAGVPVNGDNALLHSTTSRTIVFGGTYTGSGLNRVDVDGVTSLGASVTLSQSAGTLITGDEYVGNNGLAVHGQSGGSNSVTSSLYLGYTSSASGWYVLSGTGALSVSGTEAVGFNGAGHFTQINGANTTGSLILADLPGSTGSYELSGGSLSANFARVGYDANVSATFSQTGGSATFSQLFVAAYATASSGTVSLAPGANLQTGTADIGANGAGTLALTGGVFNASSLVRLGPATGSTGYAYNSGGAVLASQLTIGDAGTGSYNQSAGATNVSGQVTIASAPGSAGSVNLSGGTFTAGSLTNNDTYYQTGGTFAGALTNNSYLTLSRGTLNLAGSGLANNGQVSLQNGALVTGTGPANNYGRILIDGNTTFSNSGSLANYAELTFEAGNLTLATNSAPAFNSGNLNLVPGWQLRLTGTGGLTNYGTLNLNNATVAGPAGTLVNRYGATIIGAGLISAPFSNQGGRLLLTGGTLSVLNPFSSSGVILLADNTASLAGGAVTNTGTLQGVGSVSNDITNLGGTVEATGPGTLVLGGVVSNSVTGLLAADAGAKLLVTGSFASNAGTINLNGGTFDTNGQALANNRIIAGFGTFRTGGLTNNSAVTLTGGNSTVNGNVTNNAGATIALRYNPALFTGQVTNNGTITLTSAQVSFASTYTGAPPADPTGVALGPGFSPDSSDGGLPGTGSVSLADPASSLTASYLRQSSLTSAGPVTLRPSFQGGQTSSLSSLTLVAPTGSLDLADNKLILSSVATPTATLRAYLLNHQLFSSTANADPQHRLALAYADNALLAATSWGGLPVPSTSVLLKLTYQGDANLDGVINADDYALLDRGFSAHASTWTSGDFNYDGVVNASDYLLIDRNLTLQSGTYSPSDTLLATRESQFGPAYVQALLTSIPEPTSLAACGVATLSLSRRRRR